MAAREAAATAETLDALRATLAAFEGCNLRHTATNLVFADGNPAARVMFVGEAPGMEEDLQGLPFVGRSGRLLDLMLKAIGLDRASAYIANVIPWRPPGNRDPTPQETEICRPFIERQIALVDPDFLVLLGKASAQQLLKTNMAITRLRGQWRPYHTGRREIRAMPTLHPAYLLRQPLQKRLAWRDLLALKKAMEVAGARRRLAKRRISRLADNPDGNAGCWSRSRSVLQQGPPTPAWITGGRVSFFLQTEIARDYRDFRTVSSSETPLGALWTVAL